MKLMKIKGIYHARYRAGTTPAGRPKYQTISTKCTVRQEAKRVVDTAGIPELERAASAGALTKEVVGRIAAGRKMTVEQCLAPFEEWMKACARSPKTINNNMIIIRSWMAEMNLSAVNPNNINPSDVSRWINNPKSDSKLGSRRVNLAAIRTFFNCLVAKGWVINNPAARGSVGIDYSVMTHDQKETQERAPFTEDEVLKLIAESDDAFWKFAIRCSWETGLRLGDVCELEWKCFQGSEMVVWQGKTDQRIKHTLSPELLNMLSEIPVVDSVHVFPEQMAVIRDVKRRALLSVQFKRLCERCGIEGKSFHCLRHSAATEASKDDESKELVEKLVEHLGVEKARRLLGHKSSKTTRGYVH